MPEPAPTPAPEPQAEPPAQEPEPTTLTQEQVDRIVEQRLARERQKFADYDDLKQKAARLDELEAERKSELERAQERIAALEAAKQAAETARQEALTRSAFLASAAGKVVDPDAAFMLIDKSQIVYDDDGNPTNVGELIDSLVTAKPYLAPSTTPTPKPAPQGARGGGDVITREDLKSMSADEIAKAQAEGRLAHLFGQ